MRSYGDIAVGDEGQIELVLQPTRDADVQVSWIMVTLDEATTPEPAQVTLSADAVTAGDRITVDVAGLEPDEVVSFALHSDPIDMGTVTADGSGAGTLSWLVPTDVAAGKHHVVMTRADGTEVRAPLTVRAAQPGTGGVGGGTTTGTGSAPPVSAAWPPPDSTPPGSPRRWPSLRCCSRPAAWRSPDDGASAADRRDHGVPSQTTVCGGTPTRPVLWPSGGVQVGWPSLAPRMRVRGCSQW